MRKKLIIIIYVILIILFLNFIIQIPYVIKYNAGNKLYNEGKYKEAKNEYLESLKFYPKKEHECKIRINLALSILKNISFGDNDYTKLINFNSARRSTYRK
ncbi:MAG: hypothetical protein HFJ50_08020 [Clostridia bacterium]|jgi:hypothetical protein|nr:hypothetical protein [Clostridia bacterium]